MAWTCSICSLENKDLTLSCTGCGNEKPPGADSWRCQFCTLENSEVNNIPLVLTSLYCKFCQCLLMQAHGIIFMISICTVCGILKSFIFFVISAVFKLQSALPDVSVFLSFPPFISMIS